MAFDFKGAFGSFKTRAGELANTGVAQSKRLAEIAKLKAANMSEEDAIKRAYIELGKAYYEDHCADAEGDLAVACEKITAAKAAIETNNDRIAELNNNSEEEAEEFDQSDIVAEVEPVDVETVEEVTEAVAEEAAPEVAIKEEVQQ